MARISIVSAGALLAVLAGCAVPGTPRYDAAFGESVRQARALQTLNPSASANADPVTGVDGQAARSSMDRYQESFRAPPRTFEVLNIGGSTIGTSQ